MSVHSSVPSSPAHGAAVEVIVRESSAEQSTFLGRTKPGMVTSGNIQSMASGHGSGTEEPLLLSSPGPCHEPILTKKPTASAAMRLRKSDL